MANYPVSLDTITNPTSGNTLDNPSHSLQHSDANDILEALERKVGIGTAVAGSATAGHALVASTGGTTSWTTIGTAGLNSGTALSTTYMRADGSGGVVFDNDAWISYTPTLTNMTLGNGTMTAYYKQIGKLVEVYVSITFGSTTSISANPKIGYPVTARTTGNDQFVGTGSLSDAGIATYLITMGQEATTYCALYAIKSDGTYTTITSVLATVPFTFGTGDAIRVAFKYEAA